MSAIKLFKSSTHQPEIGISERLSIANFVTPTLIESVSGDVAGVIRLKGFYCETSTTAEVNQKHHIWASALNRLGSEFGVYSYVLRKKVQMRMSGEFTSYLGKALDRDYHARYASDDFYRNELYLCVIYKGFDSGKAGKSFNWLSQLSRKKLSVHRDHYRQQAVEKTTTKIRELISLLSCYGPHWLNSDELSNGDNEVLSFLGDLVNGLTNEKLKNYHDFQAFAPNLKTMQSPLFPEKNLSQYLGKGSVWFGERIQWADGNGGNKFGAVITLKDLNGHAGTGTISPTIMVRLMRLPMEFVYFTAFLPETSEVALKMVAAQERRFVSSKDASLSQKQQLLMLKDDLASQRSTLGATQTQLLVLSDSLESLRDKVESANKCLREAGIQGVIESFNQESCFWAMMPFNHAYLSRIRYLQDSAYADLFPMTNYPLGHWNQNHLGGAVTLVDTYSASPMFFNFHKCGSEIGGTPTLGHSLTVGVTGSGKSVLLAFMMGQLERYNTRIIVFDFLQGLEVPIRAYGGDYFRLSPDSPEQSRFNPFSLPDSHGNRSFLKSWLAELVRFDGESFIPGNIQEDLSACVEYAYDRLAPHERHLSNVLAHLPVNFERIHALNLWCKAGNGRYSDGDYSYLFDNDNESITLTNRMVGFDLTGLMKQQAKVVHVVTMYLFHCIESSLDGEPVGIICDEAQNIIDTPHFAARLKDWLAQMRKMNTFINFLTQLPETFLNSEICASLIGNTHTHVFFPNHKAKYEHYQAFDFSPEEFAFIKNTSEKGYFLYKFGDESTICRLNLHGLDQYLNILGADKKSPELCEEARLEAGNNPEDWLPVYQTKLQEYRNKRKGASHDYHST